ncbi:MAG TPA: hypothetical protein VGP26_16470 [Actinophytocola sp.]|jgi:hypothetical protein|nr:hypothetical protein [Actinophytocola sp.]
MRIRTFALATAALATMGVTALSTASTAAATEQAPAAQKARNCVVDVSNGTTACYANFTKALAAATGGKVTDAPADASTAVQDPRLAARLNATPSKKNTSMVNRAAGDIVIGIEYEDSDFEDSSLIYSAAWSCTGPTDNVDWQAASLPSGWNDQIGSYHGYANCWTRHFEHINFAGVSTAYDGGQADMGWMDDEASSIQWS